MFSKPRKVLNSTYIDITKRNIPAGIIELNKNGVFFWGTEQIRLDLYDMKAITDKMKSVRDCNEELIQTKKADRED